MPIIPALVILNKRIKANLAYIVKFSLKKIRRRRRITTEQTKAGTGSLQPRLYEPAPSRSRLLCSVSVVHDLSLLLLLVGVVRINCSLSCDLPGTSEAAATLGPHMYYYV